MNKVSEAYLESQSGKLCEEIKKAYLAGQNIVYVITKDYDVVKHAIDKNPIYFLCSQPETEVVTTNTSRQGTIVNENKTYIKQNLFYGLESLKKANPSVPSFYVVTYKSHQINDQTPNYLNEYLKCFVDNLASLTSAKDISIYRRSMVIIVSPRMIDIPVEVSLYSHVIRVEDPTNNEVRSRIEELVRELDKIEVASQPNNSAYIDQLTNLTKGLSLNKISQIFSRIKSEMDYVYIPVRNTDRFHEIEKIILEEKAKLIENSAILRLIKTKKSLRKTSGMEGLSKWLSERKHIILHPDEAMAEGLIPQPKGLLLYGIPGTGKSLAAKTTAAEFGNLPLLQLDMGNIMDKYQGESEHKMEEALKLAEAMSPCVLWIDEIEKGIAGASGSSEGNESMKRIFGKLLTWMQEKEEREVCCFVFATANSIDNIPSELFRSGRFDKKFYTFLPTRDECIEIFKNQISEQIKQYKNYCIRKSLPIRELFDVSILNNSFFASILDSKSVICDELTSEDVFISKNNRFMTGSDINAIIQRAKLILYNSGMFSKKDSPVFRASDYREALKTAISEMRAYSQTDAKKVFECYAQMAEKNFVSVSGNEIVPFCFFDSFADGDTPLFDIKSENAREHQSHLTSLYDKQLFLYVGIGVNQYLKK